jgi:pyridoxal 5'-phosphate synthase pdxS subunit
LTILRGLDKFFANNLSAGAENMSELLWSERQKSTWKSKIGLAEMLKGGVIMDVVDVEQAKIAEEAGAAAIMALERVPADIRVQGGVARMSDPKMIKEIQEAVTIPSWPRPG